MLTRTTLDLNRPELHAEYCEGRDFGPDAPSYEAALRYFQIYQRWASRGVWSPLAGATRESAALAGAFWLGVVHRHELAARDAA